MTTPINPVDIENAIRTVSDQIARGVGICDERYRAFLDADRAYDAAYAKAYLNADGPAHRVRFEAEVSTERLRKARDDADAAYRYADRRAKALESELRAWQSVGASVRAMYGSVGAYAG